MNIILPRINPHGGSNRRFRVMMQPTTIGHGNVGAISAKKMLEAGGIKVGKLVRVLPKGKKSEGVPKVLSSFNQQKGVKVPPIVGKVTAPKVTETEERLTDLLEAVQEVKPKVDAVNDGMAEAENVPEVKVEEIAAAEGKVAEMPQLEKSGEFVVEQSLSETTIVEEPRKKRRGRKSRKALAAKNSEQGLL